MEIDEINIDDIVIDKDEAKCTITNKTTNSIEVFIEKKSLNGISCAQWFTIKDFNKRFSSEKE